LIHSFLIDNGIVNDYDTIRWREYEKYRRKYAATVSSFPWTDKQSQSKSRQ
jgi:hypothetical protein